MDRKTVYAFNTGLATVYGNLIPHMLLPLLHCTLVDETEVLKIKNTSNLVPAHTWNLNLNNVEEFLSLFIYYQ